jgi:hypothetical protein
MFFCFYFESAEADDDPGTEKNATSAPPSAADFKLTLVCGAAWRVGEGWMWVRERERERERESERKRGALVYQLTHIHSPTHSLSL